MPWILEVSELKLEISILGTDVTLVSLTVGLAKKAMITKIFLYLEV